MTTVVCTCDGKWSGVKAHSESRCCALHCLYCQGEGKQPPRAILAKRIGHFYKFIENFDNNARKASKVLSLTLAQDKCGEPVCGVSDHSIAHYIRLANSQGVAVGFYAGEEPPEVLFATEQTPKEQGQQ